MKLDPEMFREYDIRGDVGNGGKLNKNTFLILGKATGTYFMEKSLKNITLGHDNRKTSPDFHKAFLKGILSTGCNIIDVGMVPTPVLYFSTIQYKADAGCMITASHTPPDYNGLKITVGFLSIYGYEIKKIRSIADSGNFLKGKGNLSADDPIEDYIKKIKKRIKLKRKLKIVVDCGNGLAGLVAPRIMRELGCDVDVLYGDPDGDFPNHLPDSNKEENLQDLIKRVKKIKADIGIAFDGDVDRISAVDCEGDIVLGDYLLAIFFREQANKKRSKKVVTDIKCSQAVIDDINRNNGHVILCRTGHSLIEEMMLKEHALLGGEVSGHMFFRDQYYGFDDAIYASMRLLRILSESKSNLNKMIASLPKYYTSKEYRLFCPDDKKFGIVENIKKYFEVDYNIIDIDGARVSFKDGWGLIRASNTQPELSVRFESKTKKGYDEIKRVLKKEIKKYEDIKGNID